MRIARQSEQFGLQEEEPRSRCGKTAMVGDPALFADMLRGPRIQGGLLRVEECDEE